MAEEGEIRRRNAAKTRARILAAAFDAFAEQGYAKAGTRDIAAQAGISASLIARYFGTKAQLFEEALIHGIYSHSLFVRDKARFGEEMARLVVEAADARLTTMMVLAVADPESRAVVQKVAERHVIGPLAEWIGGPDARARAANMLSLLHGFVIQSRLLSADHVDSAQVRWLADALQDILTRE
jgi:AcrR family transcriptional regulator